MPKKKVEPVRVKYHGGIAWRVIIPRELTNGIRKTRFFPLRADADAFAASVEMDRLAKRDGLHVLQHDERGAVMQALKRVGMDAGKLTAAVEHYLSQNPTSEKTISALAEECLAVKSASDKSETYQTTLKVSFDKFCDAFPGAKCHEIKPSQIESWLYAAGRKTSHGTIKVWTNETRRWYLKNIRTLFAYGVRRGYLRENPADRVEKPMVTDKAPSLFTVPECQRIMHWARANDPELVHFLALQLFCGLRASEAKRIEKSNIQAGHIDIGASKAKTRRRRLIPMNDTLKAWLEVSKTMDVSELRGRMERLAEGAKVKWKRNALRHSFVSYHYAAHQNAALTAALAGHTEQILFSNYRELVTKSDAEKFWSILPKPAVVQKIKENP